MRLIEQYLIHEGFQVEATGDGSRAVQIVREQSPEVVILDLGLPGLDGVEICRQIRMFSDCYIIMLTARAEEVDRLVGLSVGADDYVTKPFSPRELMLRVKAMLRRPRGAPETGLDTYQLGDLRVDLAGREVYLRGQTVDLTLTEFEILATLLSKPGVTLSRRALLAKVWGDDWYGNTHLVDVHIGHLRRKLGDDPMNPQFIHTVRGIGYKTGPPR